MAANTLQELFIEELRDTYDAEKRLTKALPKMARAAVSDELETAFTDHLAETENQIKRLEQVFRSFGEKPRGKKCDGMMGIIEEGNTAIEELEGSVLDAALIAGAQKAEHYEIASYGTLAYFAELLGNREAKSLLGQTLEEEKAADLKLSRIAKSQVNRDALVGAGTEEEEQRGNLRATGDAGRAMAMDRSSRSRSTGRAAATGRRTAPKRTRS
jgi:ferritin-like metal-binding protein YciE